MPAHSPLGGFFSLMFASNAPPARLSLSYSGSSSSRALRGYHHLAYYPVCIFPVCFCDDLEFFLMLVIPEEKTCPSLSLPIYLPGLCACCFSCDALGLSSRMLLHCLLFLFSGMFS